MERGKGNVIIVQGGQWGSEAKGLITHKLTLERKPHIAIRTGTVNAGHTVYYEDRAYAMQQIPVSWVRPETTLVLGPGAYIHPTIFKRELDWIGVAQPKRHRPFVLVDYRCGIHTEHHTELATEANRHHLMGATGKGCSEAVVHKIKSRGGIPATFLEWCEENPGFAADGRFQFIDTVELVNAAYDRGQTLLLEGTQGTLLDLHLGPYPYTTHKQTQAASWLAEAGLSANVKKEVWGVYRTFPIRVAGNSGPMPREISWPDFTRDFCPDIVHPNAVLEFEQVFDRVRRERYPAAPDGDPAYWSPASREAHREACSELHALTLRTLSEGSRRELLKLWEVTTVTRKLRRIAKWDWPTFQYSIMLNRPDYIALTFMNYRFPNLWGISVNDYPDRDMLPAHDFIIQVEENAGCPVNIASFGPGIDHTHMAWESHAEGRMGR